MPVTSPLPYIGGAILGGTPGSILFVDSSARIGQNNSQIFWDNTNFRLGIGTATPFAGIQVGATPNPTGGTSNDVVIGGRLFVTDRAGVNFTTGRQAAFAIQPTTNLNGIWNFSIDFSALATAGLTRGMVIVASGTLAATTGTATISGGFISINPGIPTGVNATISGMSFQVAPVSEAGTTTGITNMFGLDMNVLGPTTSGSLFTTKMAGCRVAITNRSKPVTLAVCYDAIAGTGGINAAVTDFAVFNASATMFDSANVTGWSLVRFNYTPTLPTGNRLCFNITSTLPSIHGGKWSAGQTSLPTAWLHIAASDGSANNTPLKFTDGLRTIVAEAGAVEVELDDIYYTLALSATRHPFVLAQSGLTAGRVPFASASNNGRLSDHANFLYDPALFSSAGALTLLGKLYVVESGFSDDGLSKIQFGRTSTDTGSVNRACFSALMTTNNSSASSANFMGFDGGANITGSGNITQTGVGLGVVGLRGTVEVNSAATIGSLTALNGLVYIHTGNPTITNMFCVAARWDLFGSATITNTYGVYIMDPNTNGVRPTNNYGLYIADQAGGVTLNYAIYSNGGQSVHKGKFSVGAVTAPTEVLDIFGNLKFPSGGNLITDTTNGTKFGTATAQKIGFWNATPVAQPSAYTQTYSTADKTNANLTSATLTDSTGGTANTTVAAVAAGVDLTNNATINDNFADVTAQINALRVDLEDVKQLANSIIDDLQSIGLLA